MSRRIIFWVNIVFVALGDPSFSFEFVLFPILFLYIFFVSFVLKKWFPQLLWNAELRLSLFVPRKCSVHKNINADSFKTVYLKQAMVEYYNIALSNYDCENPALLSLCVLNVISVVVLRSLSSFNFVIMYFNYSYIFLIFWARSNWLTILRSPCHIFFVTLCDYLDVFMYMLAKLIK